MGRWEVGRRRRTCFTLAKSLENSTKSMVPLSSTSALRKAAFRSLVDGMGFIPASAHIERTSEAKASNGRSVYLLTFQLIGSDSDSEPESESKFTSVGWSSGRSRSWSSSLVAGAKSDVAADLGRDSDPIEEPSGGGREKGVGLRL